MVAEATTVHEGGRPATERLLDESVWETLVDSVIAGTCTPFLGAGVACPYLPTGRELAQALADKFEYPLNDPTNLARVTQYIATLRKSPPFAKRRVQEQIEERRNHFIATEGRPFPENYQMLANLQLPIYLTTNYDDFLTRALSAADRRPQVQVCRWHTQLFDELDNYPEIDPTMKEPFVFHLHGQLSIPSSLLVTEDDYIDFTVSLGQQDADSVIPHRVRRALATTALLFVGYSLEDWNFRVLMRQLMKQQKVQRSQAPHSYSIQLSDTNIPRDKRDKAERFLADYLGAETISIYWGEAGPFLKELDRRCRDERTRRQQRQI
ncbi:MAG TPA: SIR2 family protein [Streptosporangiaceae bacterium]|nr:SIR2 family protein [Streptosporangiaceae bacterium]